MSLFARIGAFDDLFVLFQVTLRATYINSPGRCMTVHAFRGGWHQFTRDQASTSQANIAEIHPFNNLILQYIRTSSLLGRENYHPLHKQGIRSSLIRTLLGFIREPQPPKVPFSELTFKANHYLHSNSPPSCSGSSPSQRLPPRSVSSHSQLRLSVYGKRTSSYHDQVRWRLPVLNEQDLHYI